MERGFADAFRRMAMAVRGYEPTAVAAPASMREWTKLRRVRFTCETSRFERPPRVSCTQCRAVVAGTERGDCARPMALVYMSRIGRLRGRAGEGVRVDGFGVDASGEGEGG